MPPWYARTSRERFYEDARRAIQEVVELALKYRAQRLSVREAILAVAERHRLIRRTKGGRPLSEWISERLL
jgi:hypothetical protein